jgi:hypothetical protein
MPEWDVTWWIRKGVIRTENGEDTASGNMTRHAETDESHPVSQITLVIYFQYNLEDIDATNSGGNYFLTFGCTNATALAGVLFIPRDVIPTTNPVPIFHLYELSSDRAFEDYEAGLMIPKGADRHP